MAVDLKQDVADALSDARTETQTANVTERRLLELILLEMKLHNQILLALADSAGALNRLHGLNIEIDIKERL
jgi:hypothetical protein